MKYLLVMFAVWMGWGSFFPSAHAYGQQKTVSTHLSGHLIRSVLDQHQINYCLNLESETMAFDDSSVQIQLEHALRLWLAELEWIGISKVGIQRIACIKSNENALNLEVLLGRFGSSNQMPTTDTEHYSHPVIFLNTIARINGAGVIDLKRMVGGSSSILKSQLQSISLASKTVQDLANELLLPLAQVHANTYVILFHELGHAFGLCDTYGDSESCDPQYLSVPQSIDQPSSVMKNADYFSLTEDDRMGLIAIFQRFSTEPSLKN